MIVHNRIDVIRLARQLGPLLLLLLTYDLFVTIIFISGSDWVSINNLPLSLLGSVIALIVAFRNNAAYDRWWEGRGLWGQVVNYSRSLSRSLLTMTYDVTLQSRLIRYQIAFVMALRCSLLGLDPWKDIIGYLPPTALPKLRSAENLPAAIQNSIGQELFIACQSGLIDSIAVTSIDRILTDLANAQGGLERIKKTPIPRQYTQFPQVFIGLYCFLLPVGLVQEMGYLTPIGSTLIGFMFLALDQIGRDLQDPFEGTIHDLPLHAIVRTIEIDLLQAIDEDDRPQPIAVQDGVLW